MSSVSRRKQRIVSSCIPCYTKKQKCNRQYPCNHCTRRHKVEECAYIADPRSSHSPQGQGGVAAGAGLAQYNNQRQTPYVINDGGDGEDDRASNQETLADCFGYFEGSQSNTLELLRRFGVEQSNNLYGYRNDELCAEVLATARQEIESMPDRLILDFLVQYFFREVNWMYQLVHAPTFLTQYEAWWKQASVTRVLDVEFAVLVLEIGAYVTQFLPSPSYMADVIRGVPLADIRLHCTGSAHVLGTICSQADVAGSIIRVQHLCLAALRGQCEGNMKASWQKTASAVGVAHMIGIHRELPNSVSGEKVDFETEMRRRLFCNLYIIDFHFAACLDRPPTLSDRFCTTAPPKMHVALDVDNDGAPAAFMERVLQFKLAQFWNRQTSMSGPQDSYEPGTAESRYERFCTEFLPQVPAPFALIPNEKWDQVIPKIDQQRQLLHIAIYSSICNNFRSLLFLKSAHIRIFPEYQQGIIHQQKKSLTRAALGTLDAVKRLHQLLGATQTRLFPIVFHTFEAAVLLWALTHLSGTGRDADARSRHERSDIDSPEYSSFSRPIDPLELSQTNISHSRCVEAIKEAHERLEALAVSNIVAAAGARTLAKLLEQDNGTARLRSEPASVHTSPSNSTIFDAKVLEQVFDLPLPSPALMNEDIIWSPNMTTSDINMN
ncbi:uncharacterized protein F4822DRAFT_443768 [Hypoxylon trugodes]|uniref:uncharacterized protein n=1 Tax=Hypoxylon trugodes TaxID=326681 RepID=UPI0021A11C86|nr:uncharacterized protein F4822DRAFT_443768 [Hypoxylon trugodes]KAI1389025.1 hypothetical protein F4822DRAFT_443768 [Hypoxylon trugodes]